MKSTENYPLTTVPCTFLCIGGVFSHVITLSYIYIYILLNIIDIFCLHIFLSSKYNTKSTHDLIQVFRTIKPNNGILATLDVENLFTNVPVNETVDIIINNIYNNPSLPPLKINPNILRKLLLTCTTEVPFHDHLGIIYVDTDGVSMGSVLGLIFSNFYLFDLENSIFNNKKNLQYI